MYRPLDVTLGLAETAAFREELQPYIPAAKGSFMVDVLRAPDVFAGRTVRQIKLVGLLPSQQIVAHRDPPIAPCLRIHLPIQTNLGCWSFAGEVWTQLVTGCLYELDPTEEHGAVNWGSTIRLHLMIDVEPT